MTASAGGGIKWIFTSDPALQPPRCAKFSLQQHTDRASALDDRRIIMAMHKLGLREPENTQTSGEHAFHDDGMHYELFVDPVDNDRLFVAADHEDVGLVTWFELDGPEDWSDLCNEADEIVS